MNLIKAVMRRPFFTDGDGYGDDVYRNMDPWIETIPTFLFVGTLVLIDSISKRIRV